MKFASIFIVLTAFVTVGWLTACNPSGPHMLVATDSFGGVTGQGGGGSLTYDGQIKSIFVQRCGACHGPGLPEPNWQDYQTAYSYRDQIYQRAVVLRIMPPPGTAQASEITDQERQEIGAWIKAGAPENAASGGGSVSPSPGPTPTPTPTPTPAPPPDFTPIQTLLNQKCLACHANNGNSAVSVFPRIAGQHAWYIQTELKAFRSHARKDQDAQYYMWGVASSLDDSTIQLLAEYFKAQTPTPNAAGDPTLAALGKGIFENGIPAKGVPACAACHGANGEGSASAPRLAGQWADYIVRQLEAFKNGERTEATVMPAFATQLSADEEKDIANYVQGLH